MREGLDFQLSFEQSPDILLDLQPDAPLHDGTATAARFCATLLTREQTLGHGLFEVLGFCIIYSIAKKHGGELELRPREGGGTVATIRFSLSGS